MKGRTMKLIELSEVEILIMKSIWKLGDGITVYEIIDYLDQVYDRKYTRSTVKTYITKLKKKGFVDTQVKGNYSYSLLGLISFLTSGEDETRAWTIKEGTKAPQAAGKIHTDFERGFICAEVVSFEDLKEYGTMQACKEKGLVRQEGKEYVVKDGDIIVFRFNV